MSVRPVVISVAVNVPTRILPFAGLFAGAAVLTVALLLVTVMVVEAVESWKMSGVPAAIG